MRVRRNRLQLKLPMNNNNNNRNSTSTISNLTLTSNSNLILTSSIDKKQQFNNNDDSHSDNSVIVSDDSCIHTNNPSFLTPISSSSSSSCSSINSAGPLRSISCSSSNSSTSSGVSSAEIIITENPIEKDINRDQVITSTILDNNYINNLNNRLASISMTQIDPLSSLIADSTTTKNSMTIHSDSLSVTAAAANGTSEIVSEPLSISEPKSAPVILTLASTIPLENDNNNLEHQPQLPILLQRRKRPVFNFYLKNVGTPINKIGEEQNQVNTKIPLERQG